MAYSDGCIGIVLAPMLPLFTLDIFSLVLVQLGQLNSGGGVTNATP
jgi:hypothetical protein